MQLCIWKFRNISRTARWFYWFNSQGGLTQARDTDHPVSRRIWLFLFLLGAAFTVTNLIATTRNILEFKVATDIALVQREPGTDLEFPAVTICNNNKVHCGNLRDHIEKCEGQAECRSDRLPLLCQLYHVGHCNVSVTIAEIFNFERRISRKVCGEERVGMAFDFLNSPPPEDDEAESSEEDLSGLPLQFIDLYLQLTDEERIVLAHQPHQMIKNCTVGPGDSDSQPLCSHVTRFFHPLSGVCYAYNFVGKNVTHSPVSAVFTGAEHGLILEIDIEEKYYLRNELSPVAGVQVTVERATIYPDMGTAGFDVSPNTQTSIILSVTNVSRQSAPYTSNCTDKYLTEPEANDFSAYSSRFCQEKCFTRFILRFCNCTLPDDVPVRRLGDKEIIRGCMSTDSFVYECYGQLRLPIREELAACECHPACNELLYSTVISQGIWPSEASLNQVAARYHVVYQNHSISTSVGEFLLVGEKFPYGNMSDVDKILQHVRNSFLRVQVYYGSFNVMEINERPVYDGLASILSTFGGTISVFLGTSIISLFEILELVIRLVISVVM